MDFKLNLIHLKKYLLDIIFPIQCLNCGQGGDYLCHDCQAGIKISKIDTCVICKKISPFGKTHRECKNLSAVDCLIIATQKNQPLVHLLIKKFKYGLIKDLAKPLSLLILDKINLYNESSYYYPSPLIDDLVLIPVPLHKKRLRWRGFNQSLLLVKNISEELNFPYIDDLIRRRKFTKPQTKLNKKKRLINIKNAFEINTEKISEVKNKNFLIVDDILTTGVTINECAKVLKKFGAKQVFAVAISRG